MAQFGVYAISTGGLVVDCQAELLFDLDTRFVVPLLPAGLVNATSRLNPNFMIDGDRLTLFPQGAATVPRNELRNQIGSLVGEGHTILNALDFLLTGN